jgi:hypothetical protein
VTRVDKSKRDRQAVDLRRHAELAPAQPGDVLVTASIGPRNEAIAVWSDPSGRQALYGRTSQPGWASFADPVTAVGVAVRIVTYAPHISAVVRVQDLRLAHFHVQPLPADQILIVGARCRWRPDHPDANAVVFNSDGSVARRAVLGDGIGHVLATESGRIWVGYFDEGIFGNYGWGGPGPVPLGAPGIVRYAADLQPEWRYPGSGEAEPIDDCYALNVFGETAWATYYSHFPVVRIAEDTVRSWPGTRAAAHALMVDGSRCALVGGYREDGDRLLVGDLDRGHFRPHRLTLPGARALPDSLRLIARGADLHVFAEATWYRLHLDDLP